MWTYHKSQGEIRKLLTYKLDQLSRASIVNGYEQLLRDEPLNLEKTVNGPELLLCLWSNITHNPRVKTHEFEQAGLTMDIPKLLALEPVAVRLLWTRYDHLTHNSYSSQCKPKIKTENQVDEADVGVPMVEEPEQKYAAAQEIDKEADSSPKKGKKGKKKGSKSLRKEKGLMAGDKSIRSSDRGPQDLMAELSPETEEEWPSEMQELIKQKLDIPEDKLVSPPALDYDDFEGGEDWLDSRSSQVLGGVLFLSLLHLPQGPRAVKNWTMRSATAPEHFAPMPYIADCVARKKGDAAEVVREQDGHSKDEKPLLHITFKLPTDVYFSEDPVVARWDERRKTLRTGGISNTRFNEETRSINFYTGYTAPLCLVQDLHVNMPFQSWEVRPRGENHCAITIIAAVVDVEFEIKGEQACLTMPDDCDELKHISHRWLNVSDFIRAMKECGLNLFPNEDAGKYVSVLDKSQLLEEMLYEQMSIVSSVMAFSWSKWNTEVSRDKLVVQAATCLVDEPLLEEEWEIFVLTRQCILRLKMNEFDHKWSEEEHPDSTFEADLWHVALSLGSEDLVERLRNVDVHYTHAVYRLLKATRLITFS